MVQVEKIWAATRDDWSQTYTDLRGNSQLAFSVYSSVNATTLRA